MAEGHAQSPQESNDLVCHRCGSLLDWGQGNLYVVRIEAFADPSLPTIDKSQSLIDVASEYQRLIDQMKNMSEQELLDQVHRKLTLHLCTACYRTWIENPTAG